MNFQVDYVDLTCVDLKPAREFIPDKHYIAFYADSIPGHHFTGRTVVLVYDTYCVRFYDEAESDDECIFYSFSCSPAQYQKLLWLYGKED